MNNNLMMLLLPMLMGQKGDNSALMGTLLSQAGNQTSSNAQNQNQMLATLLNSMMTEKKPAVTTARGLTPIEDVSGAAVVAALSELIRTPRG